MNDEQFKMICDLLHTIIVNQTLILNNQLIGIGRSVGMANEEETRELVERSMKSIEAELDGLGKRLNNSIQIEDGF